MQKIQSSTHELFVGTGGLELNEAITNQCGLFNDAYGRNDAEVLEKVKQREASLELIGYLKKKRAELDQLIENEQKANNQRDAEIQILKAQANNENALTVHELHALAQWCFLEKYPISWFCRLFFQVLPNNEVPTAFYSAFNKLVNKLNELVETDSSSGRKTLYRYHEDSDGRFPIDAYKVACNRLRLRVDVPVFTWREQYSLNEINDAYMQLCEVKQGRELGAQFVSEYRRKNERPRKHTNEEKPYIDELVHSVLNDMPRATVTEQVFEIARRAKKSYSTAVRWRKSTLEKDKERSLN